MAKTFPFKLLTPTGIVYEGGAEEVTAISPLGQFGVLAEHINFITSLEPGILELRLPDGTARQYVVSGGLVEVTNGAMTVLAESVEDSRKITDRAGVTAALAGAEAKLAGMSMYAEGYEEAHHGLMLARARKEASELQPSAP